MSTRHSPNQSPSSLRSAQPDRRSRDVSCFGLRLEWKMVERGSCTSQECGEWLSTRRTSRFLSPRLQSRSITDWRMGSRASLSSYQLSLEISRVRRRQRRRSRGGKSGETISPTAACYRAHSRGRAERAAALRKLRRPSCR